MQFQLYLYILKSSGKWNGEWTGYSEAQGLYLHLYTLKTEVQW